MKMRAAGPKRSLFKLISHSLVIYRTQISQRCHFRSGSFHHMSMTSPKRMRRWSPSEWTFSTLQQEEWFIYLLEPFLTADDTICFALLAVKCEKSATRHILMHNACSLRPLTTRDLVRYASERGWWSLAAKLQRECRPCGHRDAVKHRLVAQRGLAFAEFQQIQLLHPLNITEEVLYGAASRGNLAEVAWLNHLCSYDFEKAIQCAAPHVDIVQFFLDQLNDTYPETIKYIVLKIDNTPFRAILWCSDRAAYCCVEKKDG